MSFQPKLACHDDWFETDSHPPISFFAGAVEFAVMCSAERHRKFIANLVPQFAI